MKNWVTVELQSKHDGSWWQTVELDADNWDAWTKEQREEHVLEKLYESYDNKIYGFDLYCGTDGELERWMSSNDMCKKTVAELRDAGYMDVEWKVRSFDSFLEFWNSCGADMYDGDDDDTLVLRVRHCDSYVGDVNCWEFDADAWEEMNYDERVDLLVGLFDGKYGVCELMLESEWGFIELREAALMSAEELWEDEYARKTWQLDGLTVQEWLAEQSAQRETADVE